VHEQGEARLRGLRTLVPLAASPLNAVAIAEAPGAVGALCALLDHAEMSARLDALAALSSLCALGALRAEQLLVADGALGALLALARAPGGGVPPAQRAGALAILAQAALDAAGRRQLVALGGAALFVEALAPGGPLEREADARRDATQALAHLAADEHFRQQLAAWGALPPLCAQLASGAQPDARVRACALSAVANVSFVDAPALVAAGALPRLAELLFEGEQARAHAPRARARVQDAHAQRTPRTLPSPHASRALRRRRCGWHSRRCSTCSAPPTPARCRRRSCYRAASRTPSPRCCSTCKPTSASMRSSSPARSRRSRRSPARSSRRAR